MYIPDGQEFERKKWILAAESKEDAESQVLNGWRMMKALGQVKALLISLALSTQPEDIEKWLLAAMLEFLPVSIASGKKNQTESASR